MHFFQNEICQKYLFWKEDNHTNKRNNQTQYHAFVCESLAWLNYIWKRCDHLKIKLHIFLLLTIDNNTKKRKNQAQYKTSVCEKLAWMKNIKKKVMVQKIRTKKKVKIGFFFHNKCWIIFEKVMAQKQSVKMWPKLWNCEIKKKQKQIKIKAENVIVLKNW